MTVTGFDGGVRIVLDPDEAADLADFLESFYEGADTVVDHLSAKLSEIVGQEEA